ncbi:uncharacterized protein LOC126902478 isoform X2 [Daktulosphaira vitifoliae]|uniref:uncharacterized protein LOC126902478 isoform X2 n=1 Tax=Daktulosphaira vitifoliae TaxID=58002 RepID=UPI0021AA3252|nr:uncharacterized protein LOC126902478 isoform X2 [Daktulosphaira vitifoliae]
MSTQNNLRHCLPFKYPFPTSPVFTTTTTPDPLDILSVDDEWLEFQLYNGYRVWHIIFFILTVFFSLMVLLCCCVRFRIPRTKQEIEADFMRRKIATKFCKQLRLLNDTEMDDMDLLKALKRLQAELETDDDIIEDNSEVSTKTTTPKSPSLKRSAKSSGFNSSEKLPEEPENMLGRRLATIVNILSIIKPKRKQTTNVTKQTSMTV